MRALVLAGIVALLAGCSLPYTDTSFKATVKPEHMAEGEHHELNDRGPAETAPDATAANSTALDGGGSDSTAPSTSRVGSVFPTTAQPAGE